MDLFHRKKQKIKCQIREAYGRPKTEDFDFDVIRRYADRKPKTGFQTLSEKTCNDLNFNDLFAFIDRTFSKIGQQCLYDRMRSIPEDRRELEMLEKWIDRFENNEPLRTEIQYQLQHLSGRGAYYLCDIFQTPPAKPPRWLPLAPYLSFINLIGLVLFLMFLQPRFLVILLIVTIINSVLHYLNKRNIYGLLSAMPQLIWLNRVLKKLLQVRFLREEGKITKSSVQFMNNLVKKMNFFRVDEILRGDPFGISWGIFEIIKIFFLAEPIFLFRILRQIENHEKELKEVFRFSGNVDCAVSMASLRAGLPYYCRPEIISDIKKCVLAILICR
jgi:hypothetical protein